MTSGNTITNIETETFFDDEMHKDSKRSVMGILTRINNKIYKLLR